MSITGTERMPVLEVNLNQGLTLSLYDNYLRYHEKTVGYREITAISFHVVSAKASMPVLSAVLYRIRLTTVIEDLVIEFYPYEFLGPDQSHRETEEKLVLLFQRLHQLVKPYVVFQLLLQYRAAGQLKVCNTVLSADGISTRNVWGEDANTLPWDRYAKADIKNEQLYLYRKDDDTVLSEFFFCSTDELNAFVLPDLLNYLQPCAGVIDDAAVEKINTRLSELP